MCDGLGDTIRVSLTEDSPNEIAVCNDLLEQISKLTSTDSKLDEVELSYDPFDYTRRASTEIELDEGRCGGEQTIRVIVGQSAWNKMAPRIRPGDDVRPEVYENLNLLQVDPREELRSVMIRRSLQWLMEWICQRLPRFVCWPRNYLPGED